MTRREPLPLPVIDALPMGAHRLSVLTDEGLFAACGVRIAFTAREGGVSQGPFASLNTGGHVEDDPACVARNRATVLETIGAADAPVVVPKQVHGTRVVAVQGPNEVASVQRVADEGADAVLVGCAGVAALLNFADCLPLVLVAPDGRFAVVHAGWRGALAGIAGIAARELLRAGADAGGVNAYIGPHIRRECLQVGDDVAGDFAAAFGRGVVEDGRHVNLSRVVERDLVAAGLRAERIADAGICTACNADRYFSYRAADGVCGRQAAVAVRLSD